MPNDSSPLQWDKTPNPFPTPGKTVDWSTNAENQDSLHWRSSNPEVVQIDFVQSKVVTLRVRSSGSSLITACRPGESPICRYVNVGSVFAYDNAGTLRKASSEAWRLPTDLEEAKHLPPQITMTKLGVCMAYDRDAQDLVLNFDVLADLVKGCDRSTYFRVTQVSPDVRSSTTTSEKQGSRTWAYSTDGTLWHLSGEPDGNWVAVGGEEMKELPPDFPLIQNFERTNAALVWAPSPKAGDGFCVTCFILNQSVFQLAKEGRNYFMLEKVPDTTT